jgi:hypothetical protein
MTAGQRVCGPCAQTRRDRENAARRAAHDTVIAEIRAAADPVERLLRVSRYHDKYEAESDTWALACPEWPPGGWDSAAVGRWFAARATSTGVQPTSELLTYVKRPRTLLARTLQYEPGAALPRWSFKKGSAELKTISDLEGSYTIPQWAHVLLDGQVVTWDPPPRKSLHNRSRTSIVTGPERIAPTELSMGALVLMARILGMSDDNPGLPPKRRYIESIGFREAIHSNSHLDDYGSPLRR